MLLGAISKVFIRIESSLSTVRLKNKPWHWQHCKSSQIPRENRDLSNTAASICVLQKEKKKKQKNHTLLLAE